MGPAAKTAATAAGTQLASWERCVYYLYYVTITIQADQQSFEKSIFYASHKTPKVTEKMVLSVKYMNLEADRSQYTVLFFKGHETKKISYFVPTNRSKIIASRRKSYDRDLTPRANTRVCTHK